MVIACQLECFIDLRSLIRYIKIISCMAKKNPYLIKLVNDLGLVNNHTKKPIVFS